MKKLMIYMVATFMCFGTLTLRAQSTLALVESGGGCGLLTDCLQNTLCLDIMLTPGVTADVLSYNIWVQYPGSGLSYASDNACITNNGTDNNLDDFGFYRVSGVQGTTQVTAGVPVALHTICFTYFEVGEIIGQQILVGGTVFDVLHSALTYNNPPSNEPEMPAFPFILNESSISCAVLPVTLLSFEAKRVEQTSLLHWVTMDEFNFGQFEIERSSDNIHFTRLGEIFANGGIGKHQSYVFTDRSPVPGINYYRLQMIDRDGKRVASPIRSVLFDTQPGIFTLFPNPIVARQFVIDTDEHITSIQLYDISGRAMRLDVSDQKALRYEFTLRSSIPAGLYTVVAVTKTGGVLTEKLVVLD